VRHSSNRLVLVALYLADEEQDQIAACVDEWHVAGLLGNVRIVDISKASAGELEWPTVIPNSEEWSEMAAEMNAEPWREVVVVSCRSGDIGSTTKERVNAEERLMAAVYDSYPPRNKTVTRFYTISILAAESKFNDKHLPSGYSINFLHEARNFVDVNLPLQPIGGDGPATVAFTALIATGGFACETKLPIIDVQDHTMSVSKPTRMVRALARAASAGFLLDSAVRKVMSPDSGFALATSASIKMVEDEPVLLNAFTKEVITGGHFGYEPYIPEKREEKIRVGFFAAIKKWFDGFGGYLKRAVVSTVRDEIDGHAKRFVDAFQDVLFGSDSLVTIKGSSYDTPEALTTELSRRMATLHDIKDFTLLAPGASVERATWEFLAKSSWALLDGSKLPDGISSLEQAGTRFVFTMPTVVGPKPIVTYLPIHPDLLAKLSWDEDVKFIDLLDYPSVKRFQECLDEARIEDLFDTPIPSAPEPAKTLDKPVESRVRTTMNRDERIHAETERISALVAEESLPKESITDLRARLTGLIEKLETEHGQSVLVRIAGSIQAGIDRSIVENRIAEIEDRVKGLAETEKPAESPFKKIIFSSLTGLGVLGILFAVSKFFAIAIFGSIFFIIAGVLWLAGFIVALCTKVVLLAISLRKNDFKRRDELGEIEIMIKQTLTAIKEFTRLTFMQRQFADWNRVIREIVHSPFGRLADVVDRDDQLVSIPRPPQFATARFLQDDRQKMDLQRQIWSQIHRVGYLKEVFEGLRAKWNEEYSGIVLDVVNSPEGDTSVTRDLPGLKRADGRMVLNPRSDFVEEVSGSELRRKYTRGVLDGLSAWFGSTSLKEVFSKTSHDPQTIKAFRLFDPLDFLYSSVAGEDQPLNDFSARLFSPTSGLMESNVEGRCTSEHLLNLGSFPIEIGAPLIFMTWVLEYGKKADLKQMIGFTPDDEIKPVRDLSIERPRG